MVVIGAKLRRLSSVVRTCLAFETKIKKKKIMLSLCYHNIIILQLYTKKVIVGTTLIKAKKMHKNVKLLLVLLLQKAQFNIKY